MNKNKRKKCTLWFQSREMYLHVNKGKDMLQSWDFAGVALLEQTAAPQVLIPIQKIRTHA